MLAEAGATVPEIATITGHGLEHVSRILERYLARTRHLSESAMLKFENRLPNFQWPRALLISTETVFHF